MIIACPHCQTKYQVTYEAIGSAGRKVQCAHCQQAWQQPPLSKPSAPAPQQDAVEAIVEDQLDEALAAEEKAVAAQLAQRLADEVSRQESAVAAKIDPATIRNRQRAFSRRQSAIAASQPLAQLRRGVRWGLALLLCALVAGAFFGRVQIVSRYPAMAGVYEAIGLRVNVVGLEFTDVTTQRTLRNGKDVLIVSAHIVGLNAAPTRVPAVVITLLDDAGESIYAWSISPQIEDLMAGERATFDTQLAVPPGDAQRVRLSFAEPTPVSVTLSPPDDDHSVHSLSPDQPATHAEPKAHPVAAEAEHSPSPGQPVAHAEPEPHPAAAEAEHSPSSSITTQTEHH